MRPATHYAVSDQAIVRRLIREHPWTTFVSPTSAGLVASHYPAMLEDTADGSLSILTHLGRPDDRIHELTAGHEVLAIVQGPHGYISPSWYAPDTPRVATWNFSTAHLYGVPELLSDVENVEVLTRLVAHFEQHVDDPAYLEPAVAAKFAPGTVGLRLRVNRFVCKVKMSQNKNEATQRGVLAELRGDGPYGSQALADDMERALSEGLGG